MSDFVRVPAANGRQLWFMHAAENARGRSGGRGYPTRVENLVIINTGSLLGRNQTADRPNANESDARNARVTGGVIYEPFKNMPLSQFFVREIPERIMEHRGGGGDRYRRQRSLVSINTETRAAMTHPRCLLVGII